MSCSSNSTHIWWRLLAQIQADTFLFVSLLHQVITISTTNTPIMSSAPVWLSGRRKLKSKVLQTCSKRTEQYPFLKRFQPRVLVYELLLSEACLQAANDPGLQDLSQQAFWPPAHQMTVSHPELSAGNDWTSDASCCSQSQHVIILREYVAHTHTHPSRHAHVHTHTHTHTLELWPWPSTWTT